MDLQQQLFSRKKFYFKKKFLNICILRIRYGHRNENTINGYKLYIFKMMHNVVNKNIYNYIRLLNSTSISEIPSQDELITECYIMMDKCILKFKIGNKNLFYYYFNKSLSRNFYRKYQKILKEKKVELTPELIVVHPKLRDNSEIYTVELLMSNLRFDDIEKKICRSRLKGQRTSDFLKENNITNSRYMHSLAHIKNMIRYYKKNKVL